MTETDREIFAQEVGQGLASNPKQLSSKWFYDEKGDQLFVQIMNMPEYYLTDCELEIFQSQHDDIVNSFGEQILNKRFELVELGAGDGTKTIELLRALGKTDFVYRPIDISADAIRNLEMRVKNELPAVEVEGLQGEYFRVLSSLRSDLPKVVLFLGSNIGNMHDDRANAFLTSLGKQLNPGDKLLLGVDLKKDKSIVLPAYNDAAGITAAFNLNLLHRINKELDADFNIGQFKHAPNYDEQAGIATSALESLTDQTVTVGRLKQSFHFAKGEPIHTEVSRKYDERSIAAISKNSRFELSKRFTDHRNYFCDLLFTYQG